MSSRSDHEFLADILEAIRRATAYIGELSYDEFLVDTKTQDAVIRTLEIVGEATKGLSQELRQTNSSIPWKSMAGVRDKLIHDYFGVNFDVVWQIVKDELPTVALQIQQIHNRID